MTAGPPVLPPVPGSAPAGTVALRSEGTDDTEEDPQNPGLGALGLAATLAIALAALRGSVTFIQDWNTRRLAREAETAPLREARLKRQIASEEAAAKMQGISDKAAQQRAKQIPSSQEFGRKSLGGGRGSLLSGGGSGGGGRGGGSTGPGRGGKSGSGPGSTGSGGSKGPSGKSPSTTNPSRSNSGNGKSAGGSGSGKGGPGSKSGSSGQGSKGSGKGIKSPSGGKSPSSNASSPSMERARGRQERAAARQTARLERRKARHDAGLEDRSRNRAADRDRKNAAKEARREAKAKRAEARTAEKEARKEARAAEDADRTTLGAAVAKTARKRLKKRRRKLAPPVLTTFPRKKRRKKKVKPDASTGAGSSPGTPTGSTKTPTGKNGSGTKKKPRVKVKTRKTGKTRPGKGKGSSGPGAGSAKTPTGKKGPGTKRKPKVKKPKVKTKKTSTGPGSSTSAGTGTGSDGGGWEFWTPPPRGERKSAEDSMADLADPMDGVWVPEGRTDVPGAQEGRWKRIPITAGAGSKPGSGKTSTAIKKEAPVSASGSSLPTLRSMASSEHMTEVTLDDVLNKLSDSKKQCLNTYDECAKLADKAVALRKAFLELSVELAQRHNVIGRLTSAAMAKLAESMDLIKKKALEMRTKSLAASEAVETAHDEMHDAYKPVQQATVDAGLVMPSARIHNED
ncbi:hypothetical protein P9869_35675 [Streptomyces ossamyceticus]|nr:hypothetical protein [Streptomyces ossamyceticus]